MKDPDPRTTEPPTPGTRGSMESLTGIDPEKEPLRAWKERLMVVVGFNRNIGKNSHEVVG